MESSSTNGPTEAFDEWSDPSVLEAASWRLASELVRRHPDRLRILRTHPGGGQYDCLTITTRAANGGVIQLNRLGTIQIHERFANTEAPSWAPVGWDAYLRADPREFLNRMELAAGLRSPLHVPPSTPLTLSYRCLATIAATAVKTVHPIDIQPGFIDTSGYGDGPNPALDVFTSVPAALRTQRGDDLFGQPGYRFWIVTRNQAPLLAFEQTEGLAWTTHRTGTFNLADEYRASNRNLNVLALQLLRFADEL